MSASNHSLNTHIQTGCVCECVSGAYLCCHRVRGGYRTDHRSITKLYKLCWAYGDVTYFIFTYFGLKHTEILCNLKKCVLQMVASLDSVFLQLPVLKNIFCVIKWIQWRDENYKNSGDRFPGYLFIDVFIFQFGSKLIKNPNKQKFERNQNVVSGVSAAFDSVDSSRTHWLSTSLRRVRPSGLTCDKAGTLAWLWWMTGSHISPKQEREVYIPRQAKSQLTNHFQVSVFVCVLKEPSP